jgi:hypothetical protein
MENEPINAEIYEGFSVCPNRGTGENIFDED